MAFFTIENLEEHRLIHIIEKPFNCPICYFSSASKEDLDIHLMRYAGPLMFNPLHFVSEESFDEHGILDSLDPILDESVDIMFSNGAI